MLLKKKINFKLLSCFLTLLLILTQINIQSVLALQSSASQNKICNVDGYRVIASNKVEIIMDKPPIAPDSSGAQFKLFEGVGTTGQAIAITNAALSSDTIRTTMTATASAGFNLPTGGGYLLTAGVNFNPGKTYTIVMSNTLVGGTSFTLGHTNSNHDVSFSFTCPDTIASGSNDKSVYNSSVIPTVSFMPGNNANNVSLEGNVWFTVSVPVANYDAVKNGLVLKRNGTPLNYAEFTELSSASSAFDCYKPVYNDDHTFFGFLLTQGTSKYYDFNWKPNSTYELSIPEIETINGQKISAQTLTFHTMNGDTPNKSTGSITAALSVDGKSVQIGWNAVAAGPTSTENAGWPAANGYNVYVSKDPYWNFVKLNSSLITGTTTYTSNMFGLETNTQYYVRVSPLAKSLDGSSYLEGGMYNGGNAVPFTTPASVATTSVVNGSAAAKIPSSGSTTVNYTATVKDQLGNAMNGENVTWSLQSAVAGVNIDPSSGAVTIDSTAAIGSFTVVAADGSVTNSKTVNLLTQDDQSTASFTQLASKQAGSAIAISITSAKDVYGNALSGSKAVTVTNGASGIIYSGNAAFSAGAATVTVPAANTASLTTVGNYNLTVAVDGVTNPLTVPVTIINAVANKISSYVVIDKPLSRGDTSTITVTLRDQYYNLAANAKVNMKAIPTVTNNYTNAANPSYHDESYSLTCSVGGTTIGDATTSQIFTTDANGQYQVSVQMPKDIDPSDGVSIQICQGNSNFVGSPFIYSEYIPAPAFSSAVTSDANHIAVTMDYALLGTQADINAFSITGAASKPKVKKVVISGTQVMLTLDATITHGETIGVSYKKTGTSNLTSGAEVADFSNQPVNNTVPAVPAPAKFVSAAANTAGTLITATLDKDMAALPAAPAGFSVTVNGSNDVVKAVATDSNKIELVLTTAVKKGQTVAVSYNPGTVTALDSGALTGFEAQPVATDNVLQDGYITTLAGDGTYAYKGENGPAVNSEICGASYIKTDSMGNIYYSSGACVVCEIPAVSHTQFGINMTAGNVYRVAGIVNNPNYSGDNGPATSANLCSSLSGIDIDADGNLYISDCNNYRVREVANKDHTQFGQDMKAGNIYTIAGCGTIVTYTTQADYSKSEDNIAVTSAHIQPRDVAVDSAGNLYICDGNYCTVRKVDGATNLITTIAGTPVLTKPLDSITYNNVDSGPAMTFAMRPNSLALDGNGNLFIADNFNHRVLKMDTKSGNTITYAGNGKDAFKMDCGSGPLATDVGVNPTTINLDSQGNLYIATSAWNRVDKVGTDGKITTLAGYGYAYGSMWSPIYSYDNVPATSALLSGTSSVAVDNYGNMYIGDNGQNRILSVKNCQEVVLLPPVVTSAVMLDDTHIKLTMSRDLMDKLIATNHTEPIIGDPATFTVTGTASNPTVTAVAISCNTVTLTLDKAIANNESSIKVSYTKTGGNRNIGDDNVTSYAGNLSGVENFKDQAVITDAYKLAADKAALAITYSSGDSASSVTQAITLPLGPLANGTTVIWTSSNPAVIGNDGTVNRPAWSDGDATVTMTANLTNGTATDTETFSLTVLKANAVLVTPAAPTVTADDTTNTVSGMAAGMEYSLDGAAYVAYDPIAFNAIDFSGNHTLLVRAAAAGINPAGPDTILTFTTNPVIPVAPAAPNVTNDDTANTVTGMAAGMEYNLDNAGYVTYDAATFSAIDFSGNHTLLVRVEAAGNNPVGLDTTLTFTANTPAIVNVIGVTLDQSSKILNAGDTLQLTATVSPDNATNKDVTWNSSDTAVATVDNTGKVTAVAAGTATITVTTADGNKTAQCAVTVNNSVTSNTSVTGLNLDKTSATVQINKNVTLTATVLPSNATNKNVAWSSSNPAVATVDQTGKVTGIKEGKATITATTEDGSITKQCEVTVVIDECFIATAAYGSKFQPSVVLLRHFRDDYLLTNNIGSAFVKFYYKNSPPIANFIAHNEVLKTTVRAFLTPFVAAVYGLYHPIVACMALVLICMLVLVKRKYKFHHKL